MGTSSNFTVPGGPSEDFWRSASNTVKPDGTTDTTDGIVHNGKASVGTRTVDPVATLEVSDGARSGTHGNIAGTPLYVTGPMIPLQLDGAAAYVQPTIAAEFKHSNGTQGIGVTYNGFFADGSSVNQPIVMWLKGASSFIRGWPAPLANLFNDIKDGIGAVVAGLGHVTLNKFNGIIASRHWEAFTESVGPLQVRQQFDITSNGALAPALRIQPDLAELGNTSLWIGENRLHNRKIVLFDFLTNSPTQFWGFGANPDTLRAQIPAYTNESAPYHYSFFTGTKEIFRVHGQGAVVVDPSGTNPGNGTDCLKFGSHLSGEIILSKRTVGGNQNALSFLTGAVERFTIKSNGRINMSAIPTFASNAAAITGGLVQGDIYRSATGVLSITF
jgi:hypothetical protein